MSYNVYIDQIGRLKLPDHLLTRLIARAQPRYADGLLRVNVRTNPKQTVECYLPSANARVLQELYPAND